MDSFIYVSSDAEESAVARNLGTDARPTGRQQFFRGILFCEWRSSIITAVWRENDRVWISVPGQTLPVEWE